MLLALAVVVAIPVLVHRANERNSPEATARAYLQLLADGHADQATRQVPPAVPDWVTSKVLEGTCSPGRANQNW